MPERKRRIVPRQPNVGAILPVVERMIAIDALLVGDGLIIDLAAEELGVIGRSVRRSPDHLRELAGPTVFEIDEANHPEGIRGAQATAAAIYLARTGSDKLAIRQQLEELFGYDLSTPLSEIRETYEFDVSCQGSVPQSMVAFLEANDFEDAVRNAISLGGDADTMACIAGGIAEVYWGAPTRSRGGRSAACSQSLGNHPAAADDPQDGGTGWRSWSGEYEFRPHEGISSKENLEFLASS